MLSKLRLSSSVIFTAALLTAAAIVALRRFYPEERLGLEQYVLIGLGSFALAWGGEWIFRRKPKKPAERLVKKKKNKKKQRRKR